MIKQLTASDLFFNMYTEGTKEQAEDFLTMYPYFKDVFTADELVTDFNNRL